MKKIILVLLTLVVFSCREDEITPDKVVESTTDTLIKKIVVDVINDSELRYVEVSIANHNENMIPKSFSLTLDKNGVYHLNGKASDLVEEFSYYWITVKVTSQLLDSLTIIEGDVGLGEKLDSDINIGLKGKNASLTYDPKDISNHNVYLYYYDGSFSQGVIWSSDTKLMNKLNLYDYSDNISGLNLYVDTLNFYKKNEYSDNNIQNSGLNVAKYVTGNINSKLIGITDFSCWYGSELIIDSDIEHLVNIKDGSDNIHCRF